MLIRRMAREKGFALFEFLSGFVKGNLEGLDSRRKNVVRKNDVVAKDGDGSKEDAQGGEGALGVASNVDNSVPNRESLKDGIGKTDSEGLRLNQETQRGSSRGRRNIMEQQIISRSFLNVDEYNYQNISFTSNRRFRLNMSTEKELRNRIYDDGFSSDLEFDIYGEHLGNEATLRNQGSFENSNGAYTSYEGREHVDFGNLGASVREDWMNVEDELHTKKYQFRVKSDMNSVSSSSFSDDRLFDKYLSEVSVLLKEAKESLKSRNDGTLVEEKLRKSSELLIKLSL